MHRTLFHRPWLILAMLLLPLALPAAEGEEVVAQDRSADLENKVLAPDQQPDYAYPKMALQLFNDAVNSLREYHKTHAPTRETELALAAGLINFQPVTSQRIQESSDALGKLFKDNPADEVGVMAKYLQARIEQLHRDTPNVPEALRYYKELIASQPQHPIAQRALSRVIVLELYTFDKSDLLNRGKQAVAEELAKQSAALTDPLAKRMAEMALCQAYFQFGWDRATGAQHAENALATGFVRQRSEGNYLIIVASVSEEQGQKEKALKFYKEFVAKNQRDARTFTIQRKIREMEAAGVVAADYVPTGGAQTPAPGAPDTMAPNSMGGAPLPGASGTVPGSDPSSPLP
jgi:tetratricopeptide (TPR) repeat protein